MTCGETLTQRWEVDHDSSWTFHSAPICSQFLKARRTQETFFSLHVRNTWKEPFVNRTAQPMSSDSGLVRSQSKHFAAQEMEHTLERRLNRSSWFILVSLSCLRTMEILQLIIHERAITPAMLERVIITHRPNCGRISTVGLYYVTAAAFSRRHLSTKTENDYIPPIYSLHSKRAGLGDAAVQLTQGSKRRRLIHSQMRLKLPWQSQKCN